VTAAQEATARRVLEVLRGAAGWPTRRGSPKRGGLHDASFAHEAVARVLVMVDALDVAVMQLDASGGLAYLQLASRLDDAKTRSLIRTGIEGGSS
jgi:hypothetical protein